MTLLIDKRLEDSFERLPLLLQLIEKESLDCDVIQLDDCDFKSQHIYLLSLKDLKSYLRKDKQTNLFFIVIEGTETERIVKKHQNDHYLFAVSGKNLQEIMGTIKFLVDNKETLERRGLIFQKLDEYERVHKNVQEHLQKLIGMKIDFEDDPMASAAISFYQKVVELTFSHPLESDFLLDFHDLVKKNLDLKSFYVGNDLSMLKESSILIPLNFERGHMAVLEPGKKSNNLDFYLFFIKYVYNTYYLFKQSNTNRDLLLWDTVVSAFSYPLAVFSEQGELLVYNPEFTKLNITPSQCLKLKNKETVTFSENTLKVFKDQIDFDNGGYQIILFLKEERGTARSSFNELGIITSSIAHELNNPIAGIMAAVSYLQLEDDWGDDEKQSLMEMSKSAKRCKELIEIFLGFSRSTPHKSGEGAVESSLDQAKGLLRYRMVEENSMLDLHLQQKNRFQGEINYSILSMLFYMILSESLTVMSYKKLVDETLLVGKKLEVHLREDSTSVVLNFSKFSDEIYEKISKSKLVLHLVTLLDFSFTYDDGELVFEGGKV